MYVFELRPNSSLTPREALAFYLSLVVVVLTTAAGFAALGLWLILPVAGLELVGLGAALVWSLRQGRIREYICVDGHKVSVRRSTAACDTEVEMPTPWTRVEFRKAPVRHWPGHLLLTSGGRSVEVGAFLTDGERLGLKARLDEVIAAAWRDRADCDPAEAGRQDDGY